MYREKKNQHSLTQAFKWFVYPNSTLWFNLALNSWVCTSFSVIARVTVIVQFGLWWIHVSSHISKFRWWKMWACTCK